MAVARRRKSVLAIGGRLHPADLRDRGWANLLHVNRENGNGHLWCSIDHDRVNLSVILLSLYLKPGSVYPVRVF